MYTLYIGLCKSRFTLFSSSSSSSSLSALLLWSWIQFKDYINGSEFFSATVVCLFFSSLVKHEWANLLHSKITSQTPNKITTKTTTTRTKFLLHMYPCIRFSKCCSWKYFGLKTIHVSLWTVFIVYKCRLFLYGCKNLNWMPDDGIRGLPIRLNKSI